MGTLHVGLRVSDLDRSLAFYTAVGYTVVGTVEGTAFGRLTMLRLPGDGFVIIELVYDPVRGAAGPGTGLSHLVVQVESLEATLADLAAQGIATEPPGLPAGPDGPRTSWITDPDGYRIELVQWPAMPTASPRPTSPELERAWARPRDSTPRLGTTTPEFRGPADRRLWLSTTRRRRGTIWTMDVRVDQITAVRFFREPYPFQPHFPGQEVLGVRFLGPGEDTVLHCYVGDLYDGERLRPEKLAAWRALRERYGNRDESRVDHGTLLAPAA